MRFIIAILATLLLTTSTAVQARPELTLSGPIDYGSVKPLMDATKFYIDSGEREILINIESPGGSVDATWSYLMLMWQAKNTKFTCVIRNYAYSTAFLLFTQCNRRYVYPSALLM